MRSRQSLNSILTIEVKAMGGRGAGEGGGNRNNNGGIGGERKEFREMGRGLQRSHETTKNLSVNEVGKLARDAYKNISGGRIAQYNALKQQAQKNGWTVIEKSLPKGNGVANYTNKTITINKDLNTAQKTRTLVHEIAHMKLHPNSKKPTAQKEVEAEMTAKMVADELGIKNNNAYSNHYINGWQRHGDILRSKLKDFEKDVMKAYDEIMNGFDF